MDASDRLTALLRMHAENPKDADLAFMIGNEYFQAGRHEEALPWLLSYVQLGSDVGAAHGLIAACHFRAGDEEAARQALRDGVAAALRSGHPGMAAEYRAQLDETGDQTAP
jgi:Flp pilus assembly protein TadD